MALLASSTGSHSLAGLARARRVDVWHADPAPAHSQELPALYTIGKLYRLFTYTGDRPFANQPMTQIHNAGPPWAKWNATENWAALVNDQGWGVGVIQPGIYSFIDGFHDKPNTGGSRDNPTGYIAPVRKEILDHNVVYEYRYQLALGTLDEIRAVATASRIADTRPIGDGKDVRLAFVSWKPE